MSKLGPAGVLLFALAVGLPGGALAQRSSSFWAQRPSDQEEAAARARITAPGGGRAILRCSLQDDGALSGCRVVAETPQGAGVGAALLSLAPKYRRKPPGKNDPREIHVAEDWFRFDTPPDWSRRPTPEQLLAVYPRDAMRTGIAGRAVVNCLVTVQGGLLDCVALSETPPGSGFGSAAIALTSQFTMKPARLKGAPVPSTVSIPINWEAHEGGPAPVGSKRVAPVNLPWIEAPSYADVAAAYPKKAREAKVGGRATLACDMSEEGRLRSCDVANSQPGGYGFDSAAKALARQFRLEVTSEADRKATRTLTFHLPVTFDPTMLGGAAPVIGKPNWSKLPSTEQITAAFSGLDVKGTVRVVLSCTVQPGGWVNPCTVASEDPAGAGVGPAALKLTPAFRLTTWTAEGLPTVGGTIRIPLRYEPGEAPK